VWINALIRRLTEVVGRRFWGCSAEESDSGFWISQRNIDLVTEPHEVTSSEGSDEWETTQIHPLITAMDARHLSATLTALCGAPTEDGKHKAVVISVRKGYIIIIINGA
jgi:hypothetical protein